MLSLPADVLLLRLRLSLLYHRMSIAVIEYPLYCCCFNTTLLQTGFKGTCSHGPVLMNDLPSAFRFGNRRFLCKCCHYCCTRHENLAVCLLQHICKAGRLRKRFVCCTCTKLTWRQNMFKSCLPCGLLQAKWPWLLASPVAFHSCILCMAVHLIQSR